MYCSNSLPYPPLFFFTILLYEVANIGSIPEVTFATIAPLPVGATVVSVQFRIPMFFILSLIDFGSVFTNLLLLYPFQSKFGNCPFSLANCILVSYAVSLNTVMI